ncbi:MAG: 4-hydroxy-tetrahydrodipicolinate reductase [Bacteroidota bacterium]
MNIALFGYGKMGQMLEKIGVQRGHTVTVRIDKVSEVATLDFAAIDVAIDFSTPEAAFENIRLCLENHTPVISGTTGWLHHYETALSLCKKNHGAFLYASNFSLGMNLFFALNQKLAAMMAPLKDYQVALEEIHHTQKLDAPSGTAITLAEGIIENSDYKGWKLTEAKQNEIPITAIREGQIPGTHTITYSSSVDDIQIQHMAHNREGFAMGAMVAAEWILGKTGVFSMKDVLNIG